MIERLMKSVVKTNGCWLWTGNRKPNGYGRIQINNKSFAAHRLSYALHVRPIPDGLFICHKCDNPSCVNPDHLFIGTHTDNMRDRNEKGRSNMPKGTNHHLHKLTDSDVIEIRNSGVSSRKLAGGYGVSYRTILHVKRGDTWRHI